MFAVAQRNRPSKGRLSYTSPLPAPIGGLNAIDSLADMDPEDAVILKNIVPVANKVEMRYGYSSHATGLSGAVESLIPWEGPASAKFFAADSSNIYEVTSAGAVGAADVSSLTNGRWQHVMMATSGGNFTFIVNGADSARHYNGTTWATPAITNVTSSTIINAAVHKRRIWMVEKDSTSAWYLPVDSVAGAATEFDFGPLFSKGGHLQAVGSLSSDSGTGPDDFAAFISSKGEVAVYAGTDPASADTWAIVGVFEIPPPLGSRCVRKIGGDLAIVTKGGVLSLQSIMTKDISVARRAAVTNKINPLIVSDSANYSANFGWEITTYPRREHLIINVPENQGQDQKQYVMNTITGAWCEYDNIDANTFGLFSDDLYYGGNSGTVWKLDTGYQDNGSAIVGEMVGAFDYLGRRGTIKSIKMIRPLLESEGQPEYLMSVNVDFGLEAPLGTLTAASATAGTAWDEEDWDVGEWAAGSSIVGEWQGASGVGYAFGVRMKISTNGARTSVHGFNVMASGGGLL